MLKYIIVVGLLAGCSTWADERNAFYYDLYGKCVRGESNLRGEHHLLREYMNGAKTRQLPVNSQERNVACYAEYKEHIDDINMSIATAPGVTVQPVYVLGR